MFLSFYRRFDLWFHNILCVQTIVCFLFQFFGGFGVVPATASLALGGTISILKETIWYRIPSKFSILLCRGCSRDLPSTLSTIGFMSPISIVETSLSSIRSLCLRRTQVLQMRKRFLRTSLNAKLERSFISVHCVIGCIASPRSTYWKTAFLEVMGFV